MWLSISYTCLILGVLALIATIVLAVKWSVVDIFYTVTGIKAKKMIQVYKDRSDSHERDLTRVVDTGSRSVHILTESLLSKSKIDTKELSKSEILINNKIAEFAHSESNTLKDKLTDGLKGINSKLRKTGLVSNDSVENDLGLGDLGSENVEFNTKSDNFKGNNTKVAVSTEVKEVGVEKVDNHMGTELLDNKTSLLTVDEDIETGTSLLSDEGVETEDGQGKTSMLSVELDSSEAEGVEDYQSDNSLNDWALSVSTEVSEGEEETESGTTVLSGTGLLDELEDEDYAVIEGKTSVLTLDDLEAELVETKTTALASEESKIEESSTVTENSSNVKIDLSKPAEDKTTVLTISDSGLTDSKPVDLLVSGIATPKIVVEEPKLKDGELEDLVGDVVNDNHSKTEIIGETEYRVLKEDYESIEFHEFKVEQVVTSYDSMAI